MIKITTIGGGNGQSNLLQAFHCNFDETIIINGVVSMSDDGRTTGNLMKSFDNELGLHLPPPGDLRRCLFSLSSSKYRENFIELFETIIDFDGKIYEYSILDILNKIGVKKDFITNMGSFDKNFLDFILPLSIGLKGHKFGNILMASVYYNFDKDYGKMIDFMHNLLEVKGRVIPVTTKRAYIKAILGNGEIINSQDRISNVADYSSGIADLELMECSIDASHNLQVHDAIINSDFIVIGPGDLFTSLISNFIIAGVKDSLSESKAKIIYIGNTTNKGGETTGLTHLDFVNKIERFLGKKIDYFIVNNYIPKLTDLELEKFKNNTSVKGGDFLILSNGERRELKNIGIKIIEDNLLNEEVYYKHNKEKISKIIYKLIKE